MSAMPEARLGVIEYNHNNFTECYQYATVVNELLAEVRRLRECIAKAPDNSALTGWPEKKRAEFESWQRQALGEQ